MKAVRATLGDTFRFLANMRREPMEAIRNLTIGEKGKGDIVRMSMGVRSAFFVVNPAMIREISVRPDVFAKPAKIRTMISVFGGEGIFGSSPDLWRVQRKELNRTLSPKAIRPSAHIVNEEFDEVIEKWKAYADMAEDLNVLDDLRQYALRVLFRSQFGLEDKDVEEFLQFPLEEINEHMFNAFTDPVKVASGKALLQHSCYADDVERLSAFLDRIIDEQANDPEKRSLITDIIDRSGFRDDPCHVIRQQIKEEIFHVIGAGHETTANSIAWAVHMCAQNPAIQCKLAEEVEEKIGDAESLTTDQVRGMDFMKRFFLEQLRMYPALHTAIPRQVQEDITVQDVHFPKGSFVVIPFLVLHNDPVHYENPEKVEPDRHKDDAIVGRDKHAYIPFYAGFHSCPGQGLFFLEAIVALSKTLQKFNIVAAEGYGMPKAKYGATLMPDPNVPLRLESKPQNILCEVSSVGSEIEAAGDDRTVLTAASSPQGAARCPFNHMMR